MNQPIPESSTVDSLAYIERLVLKAYLASTRDPAFRAFVQDHVARLQPGTRADKTRRSAALPSEGRGATSGGVSFPDSSRRSVRFHGMPAKAL